jgi:PKD repeat protein
MMKHLLLSGAILFFAATTIKAQTKSSAQGVKVNSQLKNAKINLNENLLNVNKATINHSCGTDQAMKDAIDNIPGVKERIEQAKVDAMLRKASLANAIQSLPPFNLDTIAIVFHVLHENGPENIPNQVIYDAVDQLNRDYQLLDPDTTDIDPYFKARSGATNIVFKLATKDPTGACTNGIIRHQTPLTVWDRTVTTNYGQNNYIYTGTTAGKWDPRKYLNIYLVKDISTGGSGGGIVVGYTYTPGTFLAGNKADAIVYNYGFLGAANKEVRSLAHEIGHWLGLPHTFHDPANPNSAGTTCGDDDIQSLVYQIAAVDDTPGTMGAFSTCPSFGSPNTCDAEPSNTQNIMDYSSCPSMFTIGQATLMREVLTQNYSARSTLVTPATKNATGIRNPIVCAPIADFTADKKSACIGANITFSDSTTNSIITSWEWDFPGGTPSTSTLEHPIVTYATPGIYAVTYTATNSAGSNTISKTNYITISSTTATNQTALSESFESISVPNADWRIDNGGSVDWVQNNSVGFTGTKSMSLNNFTNTAGAIETFYTPSYNLSAINTANPTITFTFKVAHQRKSTTASEKLQVFSSTNCGQTWSQRYSKLGASLATVAAANTSSFVPTSGQWRTETVSISAVLSQPNILFKFVFTADANGSMNNIYIDDINIGNPSVGIKEGSDESSTLFYSVFPNPNNGIMNVDFNLETPTTIKLELVDLLGKTLDLAVSKELGAGEHHFEFGKNVKLASGIYFSKLTVNGKIYTQKVIVE